MQAPFSSRCLTLAELLGDAHNLRIPDYQRGYAWTPTEAGQLLDDILQANDEASSSCADPADAYFLGAIVLMETDAAEDDASEASAVAHDIVDGLQRIITLTILLAVLRDLTSLGFPPDAGRAARAISVPLGDGTSRWRLDLTGADQQFLEAHVLKPGASSLMPADDELSDSERRMLEVREYLVGMLADEDPARLARLVAFLLDHCHCAVITTRTIDRAHRIFAVLNDRGRPLSRGDILKAQILDNIPADRRTRYRDQWVRLERSLDGSIEELLSHIRTIEGRSRHRIIEDIRALIRRSGSSAAFLDHVLLPYGAIMERIRTVSRTQPPNDKIDGDEAGIARRLVYLGWLGSADWMPPLILWWHLIGGATDRLAPFVARLDRLAYAMRLLGLGAEKRTKRYQAVLDDIRRGAVERGGSALDISRDEQRLLLYNLRNIHARSQFACKLLLLRINDEMAGTPQELDVSQLTVEHILPQKPARNSVWREWFVMADERERYTQSLGNLILVSRDRNEKARNLDLASKLDIFFAGPEPQPLITRDILGLAEWRPADVRRREERLIGIVQKMWQLGHAPGVVIGEREKAGDRVQAEESARGVRRVGNG
ncbi:MAG: DUF262 domain-containing HNH endonuclease family protein [Hyphomicrobiaceae bacterium]|nr:DUF262 domain-containing HNH endonuclease family protein [Hyphomicrobiaceae bacterium]